MDGSVQCRYKVVVDMDTRDYRTNRRQSLVSFIVLLYVSTDVNFHCIYASY